MGNNCTAYCAGEQEDEDTKKMSRDQVQSSLHRGQQESIKEESYYMTSTKTFNPGGQSSLLPGDIQMPASDKRERKGALTLKNGAVYTGEWLNQKRDGQGT